MQEDEVWNCEYWHGVKEDYHRGLISDDELEKNYGKIKHSEKILPWIRSDIEEGPKNIHTLAKFDVPPKK